MVRNSIGILFLLAALAVAQDTSPEPTFRSGTDLLQVSVVAQDKNGKPVSDIRREEFQLFDNGAQQDIRLFISQADTSQAAGPERRPAGTFTNQIAAAADGHSGYSVILIDNLFTDFGDPFKEEGSSFARVRTLQMLRSITPGEKIAIYAMAKKLDVICEFTSDLDLLERQLRKWKPNVDTPDVAARAFSGAPLRIDIPGQGAGHDTLDQPKGDVAAEAARLDALQRAALGRAEMEQVADHLAGIPGRKNLIWISGHFVTDPMTIQKLNSVGVSIYPVDVVGVCVPCQEWRPTTLMHDIAAMTGGVAYYLRNDLDVAIRQAVEDGRVSYTLGFYQSDTDRSSQTHHLTVKVIRPGIALRYRTNFEMNASRPASGSTTADLVAALNRPVDSTAVPIEASVTRSQGHLNLEASIALNSLGLTPEQDVWRGQIQVVARFITADGVLAGDAIAQALTLNVNRTSYDKSLAYHNDFRIPSRAAVFKLLVANPASGKIGTLTIPLSKVSAAKSGAE